MQAERRRVDFIQAMRGIAAVMVLLWHDREVFGISSLLANGKGGVDVFFVISGFIMVVAAAAGLSGPRDAATFAVKRFARVWPPYVVATIIYLSVISVFPWAKPIDWKYFFQSILFYPVNGGSPIYAIGWTLTLEMFFYAIISFCIAFGKFKRQAFLVFATLVALITAGVVSKASLSWAAPGFLSGYLSLLFHPCIPEFFAGAAIGALYRSDFRVPKALGASIAAILIAGFIWQFFGGVNVKVGISGLGIGSVAVMLGLVVLYKSGFDIQPPKILVWVGEISFSLYLVHVIASVVLTKTLSAYGFSAYTNGGGYLVFLLVFALILSNFFYLIFEKQLSAQVAGLGLRLINRIFGMKKSVTPAA